MVFRVLREVAMRARFGDRTDYGRAFLRFQYTQFLLQAGQTLRGHGELLHVTSFPGE
jgi:hypothetical protein